MSPSASWLVTVAVSVWPVVGRAGADRRPSRRRGPCWRLRDRDQALTAVPSAVPSLGVTSTRTVSPGSPLPASERSNVSVSGVAFDEGAHGRAVDPPHEGQADRVAVGVGLGRGGRDGGAGARVGRGERDRGDRCRVGTVTGLEVTARSWRVPSETVTRTRIRSPRSPLPAVARLSVAPVAPLMSVPLRVHW